MSLLYVSLRFTSMFEYRRLFLFWKGTHRFMSGSRLQKGFAYLSRRFRIVLLCLSMDNLLLHISIQASWSSSHRSHRMRSRRIFLSKQGHFSRPTLEIEAASWFGESLKNLLNALWWFFASRKSNPTLTHVELNSDKGYEEFMEPIRRCVHRVLGEDQWLYDCCFFLFRFWTDIVWLSITKIVNWANILCCCIARDRSKELQNEANEFVSTKYSQRSQSCYPGLECAVNPWLKQTLDMIYGLYLVQHHEILRWASFCVKFGLKAFNIPPRTIRV